MLIVVIKLKLTHVFSKAADITDFGKFLQIYSPKVTPEALIAIEIRINTRVFLTQTSLVALSINTLGRINFKALFNKLVRHFRKKTYDPIILFVY